MSIKDVSDWPDDKVPEWVRRSRERKRAKGGQWSAPKTGVACSCRKGVERDNCSTCEGTGMVIDFQAIRRGDK